MNYDDIDDDARSEAREEIYWERMEKAYRRVLAGHPHPGDPDYPGSFEEWMADRG